MAVIQASHFSTEGGYAMSDDNVVQLIQPGSFTDPLTEVLRDRRASMLAQAVEAEVAAFLAKHADHKTDDGRTAWCVTVICLGERS